MEDGGATALAGLTDWIAGGFLLFGAVFYVLGMIGLNRFPDIFTRMHAVSVSDTLGAGGLIIGMMFLAGLSLVTVKLLFLLALLLFSGPVISHALARAALHDGQKPLLMTERRRLRATDLAEIHPDLRERLGEPLTSETADDDTPVRRGGAPSNS